MSHKYSFHLTSQDWRRALPPKIIIGRQETETVEHVALKLIGFLLFYNERLQIGSNLHDENIPFVPDLVELDYQLQPKLWVECGDCTVNKLNKLAVKAHEAKIWIMQRSPEALEQLRRGMEKEELRRDRYQLIALDAAMFDEVVALLKPRNELLWVTGDFEPPSLQFDFNGLWFDAPFTVTKF